MPTGDCGQELFFFGGWALKPTTAVRKMGMKMAQLVVSIFQMNLAFRSL
jgi:hypothetical protein